MVVLELPKGRVRRPPPAAIREVFPLQRPIDVALGTSGPEDGTHVLTAALVIGRGLPGEGA